MSIQFIFFAEESDNSVLVDMLSEQLGGLIEVTYFKNTENECKPLEWSNNRGTYYITGVEYAKDIVFKPYNDSFVLDYRNSPIVEFCTPFRRSDNAYVSGRFYCCSVDKQFVKQINKFLRVLKKKMYYNKFRKTYISKSINISQSDFLVSNKIIQFMDDDIK